MLVSYNYWSTFNHDDVKTMDKKLSENITILDY